MKRKCHQSNQTKLPLLPSSWCECAFGEWSSPTMYSESENAFDARSGETRGGETGASARADGARAPGRGETRGGQRAERGVDVDERGRARRGVSRVYERARSRERRSTASGADVSTDDGTRRRREHAAKTVAHRGARRRARSSAEARGERRRFGRRERSCGVFELSEQGARRETAIVILVMFHNLQCLFASVTRLGTRTSVKSTCRPTSTDASRPPKSLNPRCRSISSRTSP